MTHWIPIPGYEGRYDVSDQGDVRRVRGSKWGKAGSLLAYTPHTSGYLRVGLGSDGMFYIHRLVLETFSGPPQEGQQAHHKNGDKTDNRLENLAWIDAPGHGSFHTARGEAHHASKLTADDVKEIRRLYATGEHTQVALADRFGVTDAMISNIVRGTSWSHVEGPLPNVQEIVATHHTAPQGEANANTKLSEKDVRRMRDLYLTGAWTSRQLAQKFGVSDISVLSALRGNTWAHVPADFAAIERMIRQNREHPNHSGERNGRSKLTTEQVKEIRRLYDGGELSCTDIAHRFGVTSGSVSQIVRRKSWRHI